MEAKLGDYPRAVSCGDDSVVGVWGAGIDAGLVIAEFDDREQSDYVLNFDLGGDAPGIKGDGLLAISGLTTGSQENRLVWIFSLSWGAAVDGAAL